MALSYIQFCHFFVNAPVHEPRMDKVEFLTLQPMESNDVLADMDIVNEEKMD